MNSSSRLVWQAISTDDNEGLICKDGRTTKRMWTFGQFSKFIRPGHHIVNVTGALPDKVLLVASMGDDGTVVVVAINETTTAVDLPITIAGGTAPANDGCPADVGNRRHCGESRGGGHRWSFHRSATGDERHDIRQPIDFR